MALLDLVTLNLQLIGMHGKEGLQEHMAGKSEMSGHPWPIILYVTPYLTWKLLTTLQS